MKKHIFTVTILTAVIVFLGAGCEYVEPISDTTSPPQQETKTQLVEIGHEASCIQLALQDKNGTQQDVPAELQEVFSCANASIKLSPNERFVVYEHDVSLKLYDVGDSNTTQMVSFHPTLEGLSCVWYNDSQTIACAAVNQYEYSGLTKLFVLEIDEDGALIDKHDFAQAPGETIDFVCGSTCGTDAFWFEDERTIGYHGHNIIAPEQTFFVEF